MVTQQTRDAPYNTNDHLVFCAKYRGPVLEGEVGDRLAELIRPEVERRGGEGLEVVVLPDQVPVVASVPPTMAIAQIIHQLKGSSSQQWREEFPFLRSRLPSLWTRWYYVGTAG